MDTSVGTKAQKKQSPLSEADAVPVVDRKFEQALLGLENACLRILESQFAENHRDPERRYWQQRFQNIATPVSLALAECKGPRRFHYHYRHRVDDETVLHPVLEPSPLATLAQVSGDALEQCQGNVVGIEDSAIIDLRNMLENALQTYLLRYKEYRKKAA